MKTLKNLALLILVLALVPASAQKKGGKEHHPDVRGVQDVHSFMELFTNLERDWTTAIQKHDAAALDKLLAPEFIVRTAVHPEHVIDRPAWMEKILPTYKIDSFSQSGMTIRVFPGDIALVSFVQSQKASVNNSDENGRFLVVDVWVANRTLNQWQAAQRYWAPTRNSR